MSRRMWDEKEIIQIAEEYGGGGEGGAVNSVNGKKGNVVLSASDIKATNSASIQSNLERIDEEINRVEGSLSNYVTLSELDEKGYMDEGAVETKIDSAIEDLPSKQYVSNYVAEQLVNKQDKLDSWSDHASVSGDTLTINYKVRQEDGSYNDVPVSFTAQGGGGGDVPANMVTTDTDQNIYGKKAFYAKVDVNDGLELSDDNTIEFCGGAEGDKSAGYIHYDHEYQTTHGEVASIVIASGGWNGSEMPSQDTELVLKSSSNINVECGENIYVKSRYGFSFVDEQYSFSTTLNQYGLQVDNGRSVLLDPINYAIKQTRPNGLQGTYTLPIEYESGTIALNEHVKDAPMSYEEVPVAHIEKSEPSFDQNKAIMDVSDLTPGKYRVEVVVKLNNGEDHVMQQEFELSDENVRTIRNWSRVVLPSVFPPEFSIRILERIGESVYAYFDNWYLIDWNYIASSTVDIIQLTPITIENVLDNKQDKLTAGPGIEIYEDGTITATGGGSTPTNMVTTDTEQVITGTKSFARGSWDDNDVTEFRIDTNGSDFYIENYNEADGIDDMITFSVAEHEPSIQVMDNTTGEYVSVKKDGLDKNGQWSYKLPEYDPDEYEQQTLATEEYVDSKVSASETWTFTLEDGTVVEKTVCIK